jgi:hypothetical protein
VAIGPRGNALVAGTTGSPDLLTTRRAHDPSFNGAFDVFVAKVFAGM